jgi:hypothetical protein
MAGEMVADRGRSESRIDPHKQDTQARLEMVSQPRCALDFSSHGIPVKAG